MQIIYLAKSYILGKIIQKKKKKKKKLEYCMLQFCLALYGLTNLCQSQ